MSPKRQKPRKAKEVNRPEPSCYASAQIVLRLPLLLAFAVAASTAEHPHIIVFLADDMGMGDIRAYDARSTIPTPAMDRVASEGLRLTDAHSPSAVCTPTRYSILTGRYPFRSGMADAVLRSAYDQPLLDDKETIADLLQRAGYRTGAFGKWHLGMTWGSPDGDPAIAGVETSQFTTRDIDFDRPILDGPLNHGFDRFFGLGSSINHGPYAFVDGDRIAEKPHEIREETLVHGRPFRQGWIAPGWDDTAQGARVCEQALAFLSQAAEDEQPFFLYYAASANHFPHSPPDQLAGRPIRGQGGDDDDAAPRNDMVVENDVILSLILERLEDPDQDGDTSDSIADNTLLIVTSDNGADTGYFAPIRDKKGSINEGGHRVPFLARWPGRIAPSRVSPITLSLVDLYATFAELVGVEVDPEAAIDSRSILPVLLGKASEHWSNGPLLIQQNGRDEVFSIRDGPWKLIVDAGRPIELYRLDRDLKEKSDLLAAEPERAASLLSTYQAIRATSGPDRPAPAALLAPAGSQASPALQSPRQR